MLQPDDPLQRSAATRARRFLYPALKEDVAVQPGHYRLVGDANGVIAIKQVIVQQFIGADNVGPGHRATGVLRTACRTIASR